jgi:uncharacterized protein
MMNGAGDPVHPDLEKAIELQQVDLRIAELSVQIDALPSQVQTLESQLSEFIHTLEDRKQRVAANQKDRRDMETDIKTIQARISKHRDQLYEVKTNDQYKAMLKEIEGEEANIRGIEDRILEKMMEADELQGHIREAEARLAGEKSRVAGEVSRLQTLRQADIEERQKLMERRATLAGGISESVLQTYERLHGGRDGVALAQARDGFCAKCHVALRPQLYNDVRTNQTIQTCESCARILYYIEPPAAADPLENSQAHGDQAAAHS